MVLKAWLYEAWCIGAVLFWITVSSYRQLSDEALEKIAAMSTQVNEFSVSGDLLSPLLVPRVAGTPENERVRDYIINYFKDLDWDVELDSFTDETPFGPKHFSNIIVTKDTNATDHLVLAAHFDSKYYENFEFIGATDSAVPCAILMSLAKHLDPILTMHPGDTTLQLMKFFDGEEAFVKWSDTDSTYGARHLAKKWSQTPYQSRVSKTVKSQTMLDRIEVLVLLDLLGTPNPRIPNYYRSTSGLFDAIADLEQRLFSLSLLETKSMKTESDLRPIFDPYSAMNFKGNLVSDDHLPFRQRGVKILHIIPAPFPYVWHNQQDNADCIDVAQVRNLAILFQAFVLEYLDLEP